MGGSEAGQNVTYVGFDDTVCPSVGNVPYYYCLTRNRWDEILAFAAATGVRLMLDLNIIGPAATEDWPATRSQLAALFHYTASAGAVREDRGGGIWAFELGNENQDQLSPQEAAQRVGEVAALLARSWPSRAQRPLLVGPSVHIVPDWMTPWCTGTGDTNLQSHSYSHACGTTPG